MIGRRAGVLGLVAVLAGASAAVAASPPSSGKLPGGGSYVVRPAGGSSVAVALWFRAPVAGFDPSPFPGLGRVAAEAVAASTPVTGTPLAQSIERTGGRLGIAAYPASIAITALVPAERAAATVRAMTAAFFAPVLDDKGLGVARRDVAEEALFHRFSPPDVIDDALLARLFADGPAKYPTYPERAPLGSVDLARVRGYAERAFRASNATLVVVGPVRPDVISSAVAGAPRPGFTGGEPPASARPDPAPSGGGPTMREPGIGLGWVGPSIADERAATALDFLADNLFGDETGVVVRAGRDLGTTVEGKFVTYHDPGVFLVTMSGGDLEASRTRALQAIAAATKPMDATAFDAARRAFTYRILDQLQSPPEISDTLGWYTVEGAPSYAPGAEGRDGRYFRAIAQLTPVYVAEVARTYLGKAPVVVTVASPAPSSSPSPASSTSPGPAPSSAPSASP